MKKLGVFLGLVTAATLVGQHQFEVVTGKAFDSAMPKDFYLEGNAIPTAKRNAVLLHLPSGSRALFSLIDTSGYSAEIIAKYVGMIITEGDVSICGQKVSVGSYGFGWARPGTGVDAPGKFSLYNQAGAKVTECATPRDANLTQPRPLQVVVNGAAAKLYYGKHYVELK
jgi:opacity protein-like surface antigen